MEIIINKNNKNDYKEKSYPDITTIKWRAGELDYKIIKKFPNLQKLNCPCNEITTIEPIRNCINLQELFCSCNKIRTLEPIRNCINLQKLYCSYNKITTLEPIRNCINLQKLFCSYNKIRTLEPIRNCINLQILFCTYNKIKTLEPISNCINLHILDCSDNQITTLEPISNCINLPHAAKPKPGCKPGFGLQKLFCSYNKIRTLEPISNCINLQKLDCSSNKITTLEPIRNCINLQKLICTDNEIRTLEPIRNCINLQELYCSSNEITTLKPIRNCINLQELYCESNQITTLEPISNCINLQELYCNNNEITILEPIRNCINLRILYCSSNQITTLEQIIYLRHLQSIDYAYNPIEIQTVQIERFLDRIHTNRNSSIYHDNQNVHDVHIQRTVCDSIQNLLKDTKPEFSLNDIINSELNDITKQSLIEYCAEKSIHSIHLITYEELLSYVWQRIQKSEHKSELLKILSEQIADSECKCFTGRFNRTLSVLVGFYDDIKIEISDKSRIGAIILAIKNRINPYNSEIHKEKAKKELLEAGYNEAEIEPWIEAIDEE